MVDWEAEALRLAKGEGAVCPPQVVSLLRSEKVPIEDVVDVCRQYAHDWPCLFYQRLPHHD